MSEEIESLRQATRSRVERDVRDALRQRPKGDPVPADDALFKSLRDAMVAALSQSTPDYALATRMFDDCYEAALEYEQHQECDAPTFNVGVVYLRSWDFSAAMHYFELSQRETRRAYQQPTLSIFDHGLFVQNFWDTIGTAVDAANFPVEIYNELWRTPFQKQRAMDDCKALTNDSRIPYFIALARRTRERELERRSGWCGSESLALAYWVLAADLARLLETEARVKTGITDPLGTILSNGFPNAMPGAPKSVSDRFNELKRVHCVHDTATFDTAFPSMKAAIENRALTDFERLSQAIYLFYATRNQVAHKVDGAMVLFRNIAAAKFTTDVLLSLCHIDGWAIP